MPNCQETLKELELFLDSELPNARIEEIMVHLTGCTDCQGAFEFHAELRTIVCVIQHEIQRRLGSRCIQ